MKKPPTVSHFRKELTALIDRWTDESDLTYAEIIASLEVKKYEIILECIKETT